jgi:hypothetical protein
MLIAKNIQHNRSLEKDEGFDNRGRFEGLLRAVWTMSQHTVQHHILPLLHSNPTSPSDIIDDHQRN